jgi:hypothetical protein
MYQISCKTYIVIKNKIRLSFNLFSSFNKRHAVKLSAIYGKRTKLLPARISLYRQELICNYKLSQDGAARYKTGVKFKTRQNGWISDIEIKNVNRL